MVIHSKAFEDKLIIFIDGYIHLIIDGKNLNLLHSHFLKGLNKFYIEFVYNGIKHTVEYDKEEKFTKILNEIKSYTKH